MTEQYAEERIRSWMLSTAPDRIPDRVLAEAFAQTRQLRQMSRRRRWASVTSRQAPMVFAVSAIAIVLLVSSIGFGRSVVPGATEPELGRPLGIPLGSTSQMSGQWVTRDEVAFTVRFAEPENEPLYWRAAVYDTFELTAWTQSVLGGDDVPAGDEVLGGTADAVADDGRRAVEFRIDPGNFRSSTILSPDTPSRVDTPVRVSYVGQARFVASIERAGDGPYTVTALVRDRSGGGAEALSVNNLRVAGQAYPTAIRERYLDVPDGALGPDARQLLDDILGEAPDPDNPYDLVSTMVDYLRDPANFIYDTDIRDIACEGLSTVECFARYRKGYCQYYATTMAILLRQLGIPTRLVAGFLPGTRTAGLDEVVRFNAAHAWVEVYFPDYGWVEFDPTGGGIAASQPLPAGKPAS
jgi:transglutaminase-like putative cysteine protease